MADEAHIPECNGDKTSEISQVQITDIIDKMATSAGAILCEEIGCDSDGTLTKEREDNCKNYIGDHIQHETSVLDTEEEKTEQAKEGIVMHDKGSDVQICQETETQSLEENEKKLGSDVANNNPCEFHEKECEEHKVQEESITNTDDLLPNKHSENMTEQVEEEAPMTETEIEMASVGSDKENGNELLSDEQENGSKYSFSVSPCDSHPESTEGPPFPVNRPDISRHSYSRYDTVSYRKIRKGNTKQRIDEFESMMNL
ncbi:ermin [Rhinophrynus dorsalis]